MYLLAKKVIKQTIIVGLFILLSFALSHGGEAVLTDIAINNTDSHLLLHFTVEECFTEDMKKAIDSGITTTFNFLIRVYKVRTFWWNKKIADIEIKHEVQYDNLKNIYMVKLFENEEEAIAVRDFDEVKKRMSRIVGIEVAELQNFLPGIRYQVCMMAELDKIRLPYNLHNIFFFLSLWDFNTDWYTVEFTY